jgi:hypothetical protein
MVRRSDGKSIVLRNSANLESHRHRSRYLICLRANISSTQYETVNSMMNNILPRWSRWWVRHPRTSCNEARNASNSGTQRVQSCLSVHVSLQKG